MDTTTPPILILNASVDVGAAPEVTFGVLADLRTHLEWAGSDASRDDFKLLNVEVADGPVRPGSVFTSTGASAMGVFHDRSEVTEVASPRLFTFTTESRLVRKHRPTWQAWYEHRYEISPQPGGSQVRYTTRVFPLNYRPYWLHPLTRRMTRMMVQRFMTANLRLLAQLAERAAGGAVIGR